MTRAGRNTEVPPIFLATPPDASAHSRRNPLACCPYSSYDSTNNSYLTVKPVHGSGGFPPIQTPPAGARLRRSARAPGSLAGRTPGTTRPPSTNSRTRTRRSTRSFGRREPGPEPRTALRPASRPATISGRSRSRGRGRTQHPTRWRALPRRWHSRSYRTACQPSHRPPGPERSRFPSKEPEPPSAVTHPTTSSLEPGSLEAIPPPLRQPRRAPARGHEQHGEVNRWPAQTPRPIKPRARSRPKKTTWRAPRSRHIRRLPAARRRRPKTSSTRFGRSSTSSTKGGRPTRTSGRHSCALEVLDPSPSRSFPTP